MVGSPFGEVLCIRMVCVFVGLLGEGSSRVVVG